MALLSESCDLNAYLWPPIWCILLPFGTKMDYIFLILLGKMALAITISQLNIHLLFLRFLYCKDFLNTYLKSSQTSLWHTMEILLIGKNRYYSKCYYRERAFNTVFKRVWPLSKKLYAPLMQQIQKWYINIKDFEPECILLSHRAPLHKVLLVEIPNWTTERISYGSFNT
jgi:hypothetical protein